MSWVTRPTIRIELPADEAGAQLDEEGGPIMMFLSGARAVSVAGALFALTACMDAGAPPAARILPITPTAAHTGGPNLGDYNAFPGQLWVCPDVPYPVIGFIYRWNIVDKATNQVVQQGISTNVTAGFCIQLAAVSTTTVGRYAAYVKEDPAQHFKVSSITASYGRNLPFAAPMPTFDSNGKGITSDLANDYGVVFTFYH